MILKVRGLIDVEPGILARWEIKILQRNYKSLGIKFGSFEALEAFLKKVSRTPAALIELM